MAIADKITSIEEHLQADYNSIEKLGIDLTNVNKNIENIAGLVDNIYDKFPKTEYQEGSNITLENTLKAKLDFEDGIVGIGDTKQNSYEGYNLWGGFNEYNTTRNNIVFSTKSNGTITAKGTSNATNSVSALVSEATSNNLYITLQAGTYNIKCEQATSNLKIQLYTLNTTMLAQLSSSSSNTFTLNEETQVFARVYIENSGTSIDTTFYIQIESGNTAHDWEPYVGKQASPNPSYPQEVKTVKGKNRLDDSSLILFNSNKYISTSNFSTEGKIELKPNTTYTLAYIKNTLNDMGMWEFDSSNNKTAITYTSSSNGNYNIRLFTTLSTTKTMSFYAGSNDTYTSVKEFLQAKELVILEGDYSSQEIPSYLPYNTVEVGIRGKNLAKEVKVTEVTTAYNGVLYLDIENDLQPNTTYTLSFIGKNGYKVYLNENITTAQWITCNGNKQSLTFTTSGNIDKTNSGQYSTSVGGWVIFKNQTGNTETTTFTEVMLETGSTATTYEPYITPITKQLSLGNFKPSKISNYKDYFYRTYGKNKLKNNATTQTIKGVTFTKYDDGSVKVSGTATGNIQYDLLTNNDNIQISSGNYYLSGCPSGGTGETYRLVIGVNGTLYGEYGSGRALTLSSGALTSYIYLASGTSVDNLIYKPMLELGTNATDFNPYGSGDWYFKGKIVEVILNSSYRASGGTTGTNAYYIATKLTDGLNDNTIALAYSNMFSPCAFNDRTGAPDSVMLQSGSVTLRTRNNTDLDWSDNTKRDNWLNTNLPIVYYVLAIPTDTKITDTNMITQLEDIYNLMSYTGTTILEVDGDLPLIIKVRALKGE